MPSCCRRASERKLRLAAHVGGKALPDPNGCAQLTCENTPQPDRYEYVQLGSLKVGIDMARGGSIGYMSSAATGGANSECCNGCRPSYLI